MSDQRLIDHASAVALRKVGNPEGYNVCGWEVLDYGGVLYRMRREVPTLPGRGKKWAGEEKTACISSDEIAAEEARFEAETGRCAKCNGSGQQWAGWSVVDGTRFEPCTRCNATGVPKK